MNHPLAKPECSQTDVVCLINNHHRPQIVPSFSYLSRMLAISENLNEAFMSTAHPLKYTKPKCPIITVFRFPCDIIVVSPPKDPTESRESESRKKECHSVLECMSRCETPRFTPILRAHVSLTIHPSASAISLNIESIIYF